MKYTDIEIHEDVIEKSMKENLWSKSYTLRVVEEYKKFIYMSTFRSVAPSYEIDQIWHSHILYSKDYEKMEKLLGN